MASTMTPAQLAASWRAEADSLDRTAKAYNRKCIEAKGVQLILLAKQLRQCAEQVEQIETANAQAPSRNARSRPAARPAQAVAEVRVSAQAGDGQSAAEAQRSDQAEGSVHVSDVRAPEASE
jgi:hypothetical protein